MVRVQLPHHLRTLAAVGREVSLKVAAPTSVAAGDEPLMIVGAIAGG